MVNNAIKNIKWQFRFEMLAFSTLASIVFLCSEAYGEETNVSSLGRVFVSSDATFDTSTEAISEYPLQTEPMFWIDANETNSWEFNDAGEILKIPSKSSSSRYLTSKGEEIIYQNYSHNLWYDSVTYSKIKKPSLAPAGDGANGFCVDFGERNSRKVLFFNPISSGEGASLSNTLSGIGTIVGVYKSVRGGGTILGGGSFSRLIDYWNIGTNLWDSVLYGKPNNNHLQRGVFWTGLQKSAPLASYWSGDWQVVVLNPASPTAIAHGLCGNCENHDEAGSAGGQKISELMIFDRILPDSDITNLVVYLQHKWLGKKPCGYNGNARISWLEIGGVKESYPGVGVDVPVNVANGDTLIIDRLVGGRSNQVRNHCLVKNGSGTLRLNESSTFGGTVNVKEGNLSLGRKPTPTFDKLPAGALLHFDPSNISTITIDGGLISKMSNLGNSGRYSVTAVQSEAARRPELIENAPQYGLNLIDFKEFNESNGRYLKFETSQAPKISTLILVVDSSTYTGAHIMNGMFTSRTTESERFFLYDQWNLTKGLFFSAANKMDTSLLLSMSSFDYGNAWVNGRKVQHETEAYDVPGLNVIAMRVPAASVHGLGGFSLQVCGGLRIGEVLGWAAALSEEQIADVQAYLMNKWLNRAAPGYAQASSSGVADVQEVVAENNTVIEVPEGETATIGHLSISGTAYKTGKGTLRIHRSTDAETRLVVREGEVVRGDLSDVGSKCEIAKEPTVHFDPSQSWMVRTHANGGTNFVWTLMDSQGLVSATDSMQTWNLPQRPFLGVESDDFCNGLQTVNFGTMICGFNSSTGRHLKLSRNIHNVRSVYFVLGSQEGGGNPLGSHSSSLSLGNEVVGGKRLDFYRGSSNDDSIKSKPLFGTASEYVKNGRLYINGILQEKASAYVPNGGYELVELHIQKGVHFSAIGNAYEYNVRGGFRLGEMIVYEHELSERERIATRNYLLKKWFAKDDAELEDLPNSPVQPPIGYSLQRVVVDFAANTPVDRGDAIVGIPEGVTVELKNIAGLPFGAKIPVFSASDVIGESNLKLAEFDGDILPSNAQIRFKLEDGILYATYAEKLGMQVIIR